ncbi:MAG: ABC transporter substrate-binding protein [Candidatus Thorarchaeota archaeon]
MIGRWFTKPSKQIATLAIVSLLAILIFSHPLVSAIDPTPSDINIGPYVDRVVYTVIANHDQIVLALQAGEIEMDTSYFDPVYLPILEADPDIDVYSSLRNGYGHITINTRDYPLNISGLRRAFAFAYDKTRVTNEIFDGFSQEHDSLVPYTNGWCVEEDFDWHYYDNRSDIGNQILDDLGFEINNVTGFRDAPNGNPFDIVIEYAGSSPEIAGGCAQIGVDALHTLHIDAERQVPTGISELDSHGEYDMVFYAKNFYSNDVDWLAYDYWSDYANVQYENPTNFVNYTYDSWRDQLLYGTTYEEVYEAASEMQKILHYNVPRLVVYENIYLQPYRNDQFTGHIEDLGRGISGPWTMRKIQNLDGSFGGTVPIAIGEEPDSFNIFVTNSAYSATILQNLWPSLYKYGPDLTPWPDLAVSMVTETHSDNSAVPDGHTRFTIDIVQNATWSDGTPLTAEDVAFTQTYLFESTPYGNPAGTDIGDLIAAYAPSEYSVVIEFCTESYWHFSRFAFDYIIPYHIFNDVDGIGYDGWNTWNPVFDPAEPHVNCGPFVFTDYEAGEFYEISNNPNFYYNPVTLDPQVNIQPIVLLVTTPTYYEGTAGNEIVWDVYDDNPGSYIIVRNGSLFANGPWDGSSIVVNIDGLTAGTYNFTLRLLDTTLNSAFSSVLIHVLEANETTPTSGTGTSTTDGIQYDAPDYAILGVSISSSCVILVCMILILKAKRTGED